jgi:hypothetical protein
VSTQPSREPVPLDTAAYCSVEQAQAMGLPADLDPEVATKACVEASRLVDWYTGKRFLPVEDELWVVTDQYGHIVGNMPVTDVEAVEFANGATYPGPMLWQGLRTVVETYDGTDLWNSPPGWWGSASGGGRPAMVKVSAVVGYDEPPLSVAKAAAILAASLAPGPFVPGADAEGNAAARYDLPPQWALTDPRTPRATPEHVERNVRTTGVPEADRLLYPWVEKARAS